MDNLKKYLRENERNLSVEEISDHVWVNVHDAIQNKRAPIKSKNFLQSSFDRLKIFLANSLNYNHSPAQYRIGWALALMIPILIFSCTYRVNRAEVIGDLVSFTVTKSSNAALQFIAGIETQYGYNVISYQSPTPEFLSYITFIKNKGEVLQSVITDLRKVPTISRLDVTPVKSNINESLFSVAVHKLFNVHVDARKPAEGDLESIIENELKNKGVDGVEATIRNGDIQLVWYEIEDPINPADDNNTDTSIPEPLIIEAIKEKEKIHDPADTIPVNTMPVVNVDQKLSTTASFTKEDYNWLHRPLSTSASWRAIRKGDDIIFYISDPRLNTKDNLWRMTFRFKVAETGLNNQNGEVEFTVNREAGSVTYKGTFNDQKGEGMYTFKPNDAFQTYLVANGFTGVDTDVMLKMFLSNINQEYINYLKENGYKNLTTYNLRTLANHFVSIDYLQNFFSFFKTHKYENVSLNQLIALKIHGVTPSFIKAFIDLGYKISLDEATTMAIHGVKPSFIKQIKENGYPNVSLSQAHTLKIHGVSHEFIQSFKNLGYKNISLNDALRLKMQGVTAAFIKSFHELGFNNLSLAQVLQIKMRGLTPAYIRAAREKGHNNLSINEYLRLKEGR